MPVAHEFLRLATRCTQEDDHVDFRQLLGAEVEGGGVDSEEAWVDGHPDARAVLWTAITELADRGANRLRPVLITTRRRVHCSEVRQHAEVRVERGDDSVLVTIACILEMPSRF